MRYILIIILAYSVVGCFHPYNHRDIHHDNHRGIHHDYHEMGPNDHHRGLDRGNPEHALERDRRF